MPSSKATCCASTRASRVARIDASGKVRSAFPGKVDSPRGAAFDARDIAITDGSSIRIFSYDGTQRFAVGRYGSRDGEFSDVGGMHLADYLYVADTGNRRVQFFTRDGIFVGKIADAPDGPQRRLQRPVAVVTDPARNLYVADSESKLIHVFSPAREWVQALGAGRGYESFQGMSVDAEGRIYVLAATERARQMVDVYHRGELEFSFSAYRAPRPRSHA